MQPTSSSKLRRSSALRSAIYKSMAMCQSWYLWVLKACAPRSLQNDSVVSPQMPRNNWRRAKHHHRPTGVRQLDPFKSSRNRSRWSASVSAQLLARASAKWATCERWRRILLPMIKLPWRSKLTLAWCRMLCKRLRCSNKMLWKMMLITEARQLSIKRLWIRKRNPWHKSD